jgi:hypothetical protein
VGQCGLIKEQRIIILSMEKETKIIIGNRIFVHHRIVSAVTRGEFVTDRICASLE